MLSESAHRVEDQTPREVNENIRVQTEMRIAYLAEHPEQLPQRLAELNREWDVERILEVMSSSFTLLGITMALARNRKWVVLPIIVQAFFLQHAVQGWCPPLTVLRRLGVRTRKEIEIERYALKALRGDFQDLPKTSESRGTAPVLEAVRR